MTKNALGVDRGSQPRRTILLALVGLALTACAGIYAPPLPAGTPEPEVVARLGAPTHVYPATDRQPRVLEYMTGPFGQATFMARIGPVKKET